MAAVKADPDALAMQLPSLLLQPVLENAIKFGLYDTVGEWYYCGGKADQNNLIIEIKNPFDPSSAPLKPGTGFGLDSIHDGLLCFFIETIVDNPTK